ncbi:MAG: dTDP-4-dehydrorhamnose reductase [Patescibacteria group bacterium]|nr:dTDP-4-dehydrorhamnose reductase [Patescibacteria group bacterium]
MRVAIVGAKGMLGRELEAAFGSNTMLGLDLPEFSLTNPAHVEQQIQAFKPDLVINAAAYTNVDACEANSDLAMAINGTAVGTLAEACRQVNARLVHYSTDYVFDGANSQGYAEDAKTNPLSAYGRTKLVGEQKLLGSSCRYLMIRTAWLFGKYRNDNVVEKIIARAKKDGKLRMVNDRWGKPTYAKDLAAVTLQLVQCGKPDGIFHVTNATPPSGITWYEFGLAIVEQLGLKIPVTPCASDEFPQAAVRPVYSLLNNTKLPPLRPWQEALKEYLSERSA